MGLRLAHGDLEALQVDFPQRPLAHDARYAAPVVLLVVAREVLDGHRRAGHRLHAAGNRRRDLAGHQRILGVILEVPAAQRVPFDVHAGRQPPGHAELFHLAGDHAADLLQRVRVKCLRQHHAHRDGRAVLVVRFRSLVVNLFLEDPGHESSRAVHVEDLAVLHLIPVLNADARGTVRQHGRGNAVLL